MILVMMSSPSLSKALAKLWEAVMFQGLQNLDREKTAKTHVLLAIPIKDI